MAEASSFEGTGLVNNGDGITLKYAATVLENSFFAVNYAIQNHLNAAKLYRKNHVSTFFASLIDYLHVIPFLVHHGYNYGEVSLSWAKFANWIQLQLPIYTYAPFSIAFWASVVVMAILIGLCVFIGYAHWNKTPGQKTVTGIAALALTGGFQLFYPAAFYLLALPWFCNWRNQNLFNIIDEGTSCFTGPNLIAIIIGTFSAITLLSFACFSSLVKSSVEPIVNDLSITTGVLFKNQYYFTVAFMTINKFLIAPSIGAESFGTWWEALFNLIAMTLLVFTLIYFLPYQVAEGNQYRGFIFTSLWWISCVSFMSVNVHPNPTLINRQLDYILIAGMLPFGLLGEYLVKTRYAHMNTFATALIEEVKVAQENKKRAAAKAAELGATTEKKVTGPRQAAKKDDKDKKDGKDAKGKDAKGKTDAKAAAAAGKTDPNKEEAEKIKNAQKAAMLALEQNAEDDEKKRNTRLYLPKILQDYDAGITTIDIVGRLLWHYTDDKLALEAASGLYEAAEKAYPEIPYVKVLRTSYATSLAADPSVHLPKLDLIKKMEPGVLSRYYVYKRATDIRDRAKLTTTTDGENSLDLVAYIEFQNLFSETKKYNNRAIQAIREFWMLFLQKSITAAAFNRAAKEMDIHSQKAVLIYKTMLTKFPKNHQVLTSYAFFLDLVLRNTEEAQRCIRRADEQKAREAEEARNGNVAGQIDSQAVVAITEDASIDQVNKALLALFGYTRNEVLGRNIKLLVPSPWKEHHDNILQRYRVTGIAKVIGKTQTLYGHHKEGYAFSMRLLVQERRKENGERNFIGMIQPSNVESKIGIVIINEMGIIKMVNKQTLDLFGGYSAGQLLNKNVVVLMIDSFAAGHDNYLKRYRDTGEARVIGTAGRNVPAKRKDGSTFPAALTVEEHFADGERFWMANIQDTSNTMGNIFIDGFGTIQNSDAGIQQLLGYKKEAIIGKNIKGIMPPPYCDYHDMYLERYRRTKVSNVLRSVEGRILPALHADGSVIQLRAIIQRADSGDASGAGGNQSMLFKGIIKRGDISGGAGTGTRRGYMADYEIELNRAGVITKLNRKILSMLGHPPEKHISDFIGQPIEVLVPVLPDKPNQQKSNWFTRALKSPELNFYLIMVNKNYTMLPITYCLEENEEGAIRMRIRDLSELDALLTIDEVGNVLSLNEDAFMLLGFDPDEVVGRNIKYIQPPEVAEHHDMYLQRYKDTGVARVVGINRNVDAMHRDGTYFPNEIQVTEQIAADGSKTFIGRLRHMKFPDRCEKDIVLRYLVNTKNLATAMSTMSADGQSAMSMTSDGTRKINFKGKKGSSKGSKGSRGLNGSGVGGIASIHDDVEAHSVLSNSLNSSSMHSGSHGSSSLSSNTKFLSLLSKLKTLKASTKEDPSNAQLGSLLNYVLAGYIVFFAIGLIVTNALPTAVPYYELLNVLLDINVVINELIYAGRTLEFQEKPETNLLYCSFKANDTRPLCPWLIAADEARTPPIPDPDALPNYPVRLQFPTYENELKAKIHAVEKSYKTIRKPGDIFDNLIQGEFKVFQFVNGSADINSTVSLQTFWNLMGTLSDNSAILAENLDLAEHSERAWNFLTANRNKLCQAIKDMAVLIPGQSKSTINNTMIFHLIMAIISVAIGVVVFIFLLVPRIRVIQADREKILRLLLLMPKSNVYDLVHRVYTTVDEEEEENNNRKDQDEDEEEEEEEEEADENGEGEAQEITVVADRSIGIYAIFAVGLASLTVPIIAHAIFRFADDQENLNTVDLIADLTTLYLDMLIISWQLFTTAVNCHKGEEAFCLYPYDVAVKNFEKYVDEMESAYNSAVKAMQGNPGVIEVFTLPMCFDTPNGLYRCFNPKSKVVSDKGTQLMPSNFVSKTFNGYSNLVQNTIRSARRLGAEVLALYKKGGVEEVKNMKDSQDDFWFLYEIPLLEGEAGINMSFRRAKSSLEKALRQGIVVANICYAVALGASVIVFFWVFGAVRKAITTETRYNRGVLYMVPHDVLRNTKAMIEYIENLYAGIGGA